MKEMENTTLWLIGRDCLKHISFNYEDCIICSEVFSSKAGRYPLSCGHSCFHSKCIKQWLERDPSCPMCRRTIPEVVDIFKAPLGEKVRWRVQLATKRQRELASVVAQLHIWLVNVPSQPVEIISRDMSGDVLFVIKHHI
ncbi:hypothetical protein EB796_000937 [Bugula neritina]|uniref:RING-type domain-containing protein n=1 Tax=Bugula neritina TaxID=10212 RepID=A0A7J7KRC8_BUGNE|nr:hypothetical protein EB796_000937 [Bugula neritina]